MVSRSRRSRGACHPGSRAGRRGSVLLIVLVVVMMLTLGAYVFTETMILEADATEAHGKRVRARVCAESGVEFVAALLGEPREPGSVGFYHRPELFQGAVMFDSERAGGRARFSVVAPVERDASGRRIRFGLMDESGKLNLNTLLADAEESSSRGAVRFLDSGTLEEGEDGEEEELDPDQVLRERLLYVPNTTEEIADAILDWIDEDDEPREYGAELEYYESLETPYAPKNGPLESLEELLLVRGVTPAHLYGEDANRNGLLDPNENDGEASLPLDNADGVLDAGWSAYFTVHSVEGNVRFDGTPRINVNQGMLAELYDAIEPEFGEDVARFVTAFRMYGPVGQEAEEGGGQSGGPGGGGGSREEQMQRFATAIMRASSGAEGAVTRGGLDLSEGASYDITTLYELVDAEVEAEVDGSTETLQSPWSSDSSSIVEDLPQLLDAFATTDEPVIRGRINVNQARRETLMTIPGMTEDVADTIVKSVMIGPDGEPVMDVAQTRATTGWLLLEDVLTIEELRELDPYLTAQGDVFRAQVLGYHDQRGPVVRLEAVLDASASPARVVFTRDLSDLGSGYPRSWLVTPVVSSVSNTQ